MFEEAFVFFYLGLSWMSVKASFISPAFIVICIIAILLGRTLVIFLLSFIVNSCPSLKMKIDFKEKTIMSFSGFIRGAISYGLAITIKTNDDQARNTLIVTVLIIVFFTTLIIGGILPFIMKKVNDEELNLANTFNSINSTSSSLSSSFVSSNYLSNDKANIETFSIQRFDKKEESNSSNINVDDNNEINLNNSFSQAGNKLKNFWSKFDQNYMKPCFIDDWPQVKNDHNEISTKIIELFELHQQKKLRNKEMSGIREKVNQRKEIMEKLREEKPFN